MREKPPSKLKAAPAKDVPVVDMTRIRNDNQNTKVGPRDYQNLHRLHEKINKPVPGRILTQTYPYSSSSGDGRRPQLLFLDRSEDNPHLTQTSSDYGDDLMENLPSTSVLLQKEASTSGEGHLQFPGPGCKENHSDDLDVLELKVGPNEIPLDNEFSNVEAAMVGMGDSRRMGGMEHPKETDAVQTDPVGPEAITEEGILNYPTYGISTSNAPNNATSTNPRLFLSTDSPEKRPSTKKRNRDSANPEVTASHRCEQRLSKKSRLTVDDQDTNEQPLFRRGTLNGTDVSASTLKASESGASAPSMRETFSNQGRPMPAWVDSMDPEFIEWFLRGYGDLVVLV